MADSAPKLRPATDSGFRQRGPVAYSLKLAGGEYPILKPATLIGRSPDCDIVLDGPLVSRQHAKILLSDHGLVLEDLGSRNGVRVSSTDVRGKRDLRVGDVIEIGHQKLEVCERSVRSSGGLHDRRNAETLSVAAVRPERASGPAVRRPETLELLGGVVEKALTAGNIDEAERLLASHLTTLIEEARAGAPIPAPTAELAARWAVRLAAATNKPSWMNYTISLHVALGTPLPLPVVDELYTLIRRIRGLDRALLRQYVSVLRARAERLNPAGRFVLQRIEGLERLAGI